MAAQSVRDAMAAGLALVPEDRQRLGLHFNLSIGDNIALPRAARDGLGWTIAVTSVRSPSPRLPVWRSGRRRSTARPTRSAAAISRRLRPRSWLATEPKVLLLDEPTRGVDVGAKFEIHSLIADAGALGHGVSRGVERSAGGARARRPHSRDARRHMRGELSGATATEESVMQLATHQLEESA